MAKKKKGSHGGSRKGAGRPPAHSDEGGTVTVAATIPKTLKIKLDRIAKAKSWNRSRAITEAIRLLVSAES